MHETTYIRSVNRLLPNDIYCWKVNDQYTSGVPDCWYSGEQSDLWIEWKYVRKLPKRAVVKPNLSELQKNWLRERHRQGRKTAVVVGSPEGCVIYWGDSWENPTLTAADAVPKKQTAEIITRWLNEMCEPHPPAH